MKGEKLIDGLVRKAMEAAGTPDRPFTLKKKGGKCFILLGERDAKGTPRGPAGNDWATALINLATVLRHEMNDAAKKKIEAASTIAPPSIAKAVKKLRKPIIK